MSKPTNQSYHLVTIADIAEKVPKDRIDACLEDLRNVLDHHQTLAQSLTTLAGTKVHSDLKEGFVFVDDGQHNLSLRIGGQTITQQDAVESLESIGLAECSSARQIADLARQEYEFLRAGKLEKVTALHDVDRTTVRVSIEVVKKHY